MRKLLNLIGIDWYALGDKVLFVDVSGNVCCGHIREHIEKKEYGIEHWRYTDHTYKIELCSINDSVVFVNESNLIKRVK